MQIQHWLGAHRVLNRHSRRGSSLLIHTVLVMCYDAYGHTSALLHVAAWLSPLLQCPSVAQTQHQIQPRLLRPQHGLLLLLSWLQPSPSAPLTAALTGARLQELCWSGCPAPPGGCAGSQHVPAWPPDKLLQHTATISHNLTRVLGQTWV